MEETPKLPAVATGANLRAAINKSTERLDAIYNALFENGAIGPIKKEALHDGLLSEEQFNNLPSGKIGISTEYLQSLNLGGVIKPDAPTNPIVNDIADTFTVTPPIGYIGADLETQIISDDVWGPWQVNTSVSFNVGNTAIPTGGIRSRVKAAPGRSASEPVASLQPFTVSEGTQYQVENTYVINFANEYGATPPDTNPRFNTFKPSVNVLEVPGEFVSPFIVNDLNIASGMKLTNSGAFSGTASPISSDQSALGDISVYPDTVVNTAWNVNGSTNAKIKITGLKPDKFYQIYGLMPVSNPDSVRGMVIAGVVKNKTATSVLGSFPAAANGLNDPEFIVYNNITGTEVEIEVKRISGDYGAYIALVVLEESNIAKP